MEEFPEDDGEAARAALPDHIYMDAMGFGMGNCCLQVLIYLKKTSLFVCLFGWLVFFYIRMRYPTVVVSVCDCKWCGCNR